MSKERFYKVFSNLPLDVRKEIVAVIDDKIITWNVAYDEIEVGSPFGEKILNKLIEMDII